jgi:hypothetical protein
MQQRQPVCKAAEHLTGRYIHIAHGSFGQVSCAVPVEMWPMVQCGRVCCFLQWTSVMHVTLQQRGSHSLSTVLESVQRLCCYQLEPIQARASGMLWVSHGSMCIGHVLHDALQLAVGLLITSCCS